MPEYNISLIYWALISAHKLTYALTITGLLGTVISAVTLTFTIVENTCFKSRTVTKILMIAVATFIIGIFAHAITPSKSDTKAILALYGLDKAIRSERLHGVADKSLQAVERLLGNVEKEK